MGSDSSPLSSKLSESKDHRSNLLLYPTFKLVGDNIDKHVKPREMRVDIQAQSLHFFNIYAVRDRVDVSHLPDAPALPDPDAINVEAVLPSPEDHEAILRNFTILAGRVLKKYMQFFTNFAFGLARHIKHQYYEEMSQKSEVVSIVLCFQFFPVLSVHIVSASRSCLYNICVSLTLHFICSLISNIVMRMPFHVPQKLKYTPCPVFHRCLSGSCRRMK